MLSDSWGSLMLESGLQDLLSCLHMPCSSDTHLAVVRVLHTLASDPHLSVLMIDQAMPAIHALKARSEDFQVNLKKQKRNHSCYIHTTVDIVLKGYVGI